LEKFFHLKEKELLMQQDELEFIHEGIISSLLFTNQLLKEGTAVDILLNKQTILTRFAKLNE